MASGFLGLPAELLLASCSSISKAGECLSLTAAASRPEATARKEEANIKKVTRPGEDSGLSSRKRKQQKEAKRVRNNFII